VMVEQDMTIEPDRVYLIPPGSIMHMGNGILSLTPKNPRTLTLPIDVFFKSMAAHYGARSVGVVLSGTGSDGTRGAASINDAGGLRIGISITRGQVSHHGAALKLREDPRFTALVGRFGSKSTVLESDFGCNGYASRRATPQRVGIAALTSHQLMR